MILFVHVVPFMAAVALRPHLSEEKKLYFSTLNFLMLLVWWVFLYAFIVFPDEYVVLNVAVYSPHYDLLYLVENLALLGVLGMLAWNTRGAWKKSTGTFSWRRASTPSSSMVAECRHRPRPISYWQHLRRSLYRFGLLVDLGRHCWRGS